MAALNEGTITVTQEPNETSRLLPQQSEGSMICSKQVFDYIKRYGKHVVVSIVIVLLCGGLRAVCSLIRWLAIHECQTTNNATTSNATGNSTQDGYFKFTAALYGVFGILQALAALAIVINIEYAFVRKTMEFKGLKCLPGVMLLLFLITLSFAICTTGLLYDLQLDNCYYTHWYQKPAVYAYHILVLITTIFISIVLFGLVFATVCVYCIWNDFVPVPEEYYKGDFDSTRASIFYTYVCYKYRTKGKEVIPFTSTFRSWFVLQWFTYFLGIFIDLTYVLRPWILGGDEGIEDM